jgi:uncharacterized membrane protein YgcG
VALQILPPCSWFINTSAARAASRQEPLPGPSVTASAGSSREAATEAGSNGDATKQTVAVLAEQLAREATLRVTDADSAAVQSPTWGPGCAGEDAPESPAHALGDRVCARDREGQVSSGGSGGGSAKRSEFRARGRSSSDGLVEATRAQLEAAYGNGAKPPWEDAKSTTHALEIIASL